MSESVITPTAASTPTPAVPGNKTAVAETPETPANERFHSALARQLQGQAPTGDEAQAAVPGALSELLQPVVGDGKFATDGKSTTDKSGKDGMDLPLSGQNLPLDPSLLVVVPPPALPAGKPATVPVANVTSDGGQRGTPPRLSLTPIASALAQEPATPESEQTGQTVSDLLTPMLPQHATVSVMHGAALAAGLTAQSSTLPATTALPTALKPITSALAQDPSTPEQTGHTVSDLLTPMLPQHASVSVMHDAALAAGLTAQSSALPATTALTNVLAPTHVQPQSTTAPAVTVPAIPIPLTQPGWDQALGQRVQWLVGQQLQGAELRITPPQLGPIEVRISIGHDQQTVVNFASPHAAVRDAIEAAVPRLRDMLGNNGQGMVNVNVSQHSFAEQRRQAGPSGGGRDSFYRSDLSLSAVGGLSGTSTPVRAGVGLVDYFA